MTHSLDKFYSHTQIRRAAHLLAAGGVIACPTEAVWGFSCDPFDAQAVARILSLKQRPVEKGLILVAGDEAQLDFLLAGLPAEIRRKLALSWPGANTWLVPHCSTVPDWIHGRFDTVAVRVSGHPLMRRLCRDFGGPLVSTSANQAGRPALRNRLGVQVQFGDVLDGILAGPLGGVSQPSTIRDAFTDEVFRA